MILGFQRKRILSCIEKIELENRNNILRSTGVKHLCSHQYETKPGDIKVLEML